MEFKKRKRRIALVLAIILVVGTFLPGFKYQDGIGNVYSETTAKVFKETFYTEQLAEHSKNGVQRTYIVATDIQESGLTPYVFEGDVAGNYTLDTMIRTLEAQGKKVVAGINGDIYDTATGTPKGLTIHQGKIKTSGYAPEYVLAFDDDGLPSLRKATLNFTLRGTINVHINQPDPEDPESGSGDGQETEPSSDGQQEQEITYVTEEYYDTIGYFNVPHGGSNSLHLYNRQYAATTRTNGNCVEVVLETGSAENAELVAGQTIRATVAEVRTGTRNTPIGESQLILSANENSYCIFNLSKLAPGSTIDITVIPYSIIGAACYIDPMGWGNHT
jgi:hypothetical protein